MHQPQEFGSSGGGHLIGEGKRHSLKMVQTGIFTSLRRPRGGLSVVRRERPAGAPWGAVQELMRGACLLDYALFVLSTLLSRP